MILFVNVLIFCKFCMVLDGDLGISWWIPSKFYLTRFSCNSLAKLVREQINFKCKNYPVPAAKWSQETNVFLIIPWEHLLQNNLIFCQINETQKQKRLWLNVIIIVFRSRLFHFMLPIPNYLQHFYYDNIIYCAPISFFPFIQFFFNIWRRKIV
jgi:hypothetical protein